MVRQRQERSGASQNEATRAVILIVALQQAGLAERAGQNAAAKTWRRLNGESQLPKVVAGVTFHDGTEVIERPSTRAA